MWRKLLFDKFSKFTCSLVHFCLVRKHWHWDSLCKLCKIYLWMIYKIINSFSVNKYKRLCKTLALLLKKFLVLTLWGQMLHTLYLHTLPRLEKQQAMVQEKLTVQGGTTVGQTITVTTTTSGLSQTAAQIKAQMEQQLKQQRLALQQKRLQVN